MTSTTKAARLTSTKVAQNEVQATGFKSQMKKKLLNDDMTLSAAKIQLRNDPLLQKICNVLDLENWSQGIDTGRKAAHAEIVELSEEEWIELQAEEAALAARKAAKKAAKESEEANEVKKAARIKEQSEQAAALERQGIVQNKA